jgi:hydroxypyruvate isomerase
MARIKQCVCYPILGERIQMPGAAAAADAIPLERLFTELARIGYVGVELWDRPANFDDICKLAADTGLKVVSMVGGGGLTERRNHDKTLAQVKASLDVAVEKGIPNLIVLSGNRTAGLSDDAAVAVVAEGLARLAMPADRANVNLNLELLNSKLDHKGYQADRTGWALQAIKRVRSPRVKLLYDIYHMQIMEGDVIRTIRGGIDFIGHFHTAGVPGRADLDDEQELNYRGICRAIAATAYDGYLSHEFKPRGDVIESLRRAYQICGVG